MCVCVRSIPTCCPEQPVNTSTIRVLARLCYTTEAVVGSCPAVRTRKSLLLWVLPRRKEDKLHDTEGHLLCRERLRRKVVFSTGRREYLGCVCVRLCKARPFLFFNIYIILPFFLLSTSPALSSFLKDLNRQTFIIRLLK